MMQYRLSNELTIEINKILVENNFLLSKINVLRDGNVTNDSVENIDHTQGFVDQNAKNIDDMITKELNQYIDKLDENSDDKPISGDVVFNVNAKLLGALFYKSFIIHRQ